MGRCVNLTASVTGKEKLPSRKAQRRRQKGLMRESRTISMRKWREPAVEDVDRQEWVREARSVRDEVMGWYAVSHLYCMCLPGKQSVPY